MIVVTVVTVVSIVGRSLIQFGLSPIPGDFEIVQAGMLFAIFSFLPWCHLTRGNALVAHDAIIRARRGVNAYLIEHETRRVLFAGDTDERAGSEGGADEFDAAPRTVLREMVAGGVNLPWTLALCVGIGLWLLFTRATLGAEGTMADADPLIGSLVLTVISIAAAEVARPARLLLVPLGLALAAMPFLTAASGVQSVVGVVLGLALVMLSLRRGPIRGRYGSWQRLIV